MVYYGLSIMMGIAYLWLYRGQKSRPGQTFFFLAILFFIFCGLFENFFGRFGTLLRDSLDFIFDIAPFALAFFGVAIVLHAVRRLHKRGWSRKYGTLAILACVMLVLLGLVYFNRMWWGNEWIYLISFLLDYLFLYLVITFLVFLMMGSMYRFIRPDLQKDYIIILGTGLLPDGSLSYLLKFRLDEALRFYRKQIASGETPAKLIVSGGKGPDEQYAEAEVMGHYLQDQGVDASQIIVEDQSINTHQNFLFSKRYMKENNRGTVFVTNNFHVLRSGLYARQMGIKADGLGAKTPLHYLPYALIREYLALLLIFRTFHVIVASIFLAASVFLCR